MRIYIDFKSAPAYLAIKPTLALLGRLSIPAQWLPFDTRQTPLPGARENETRGETHVRVRQEQRQQTCLKYAGIQGIPMAYPDEPGQTRCALAALLHLQAEPLPFIEAAFTAYWRDHRDLDDTAVVKELLAASGGDGAGFDPADYAHQLAILQDEAVELGVFETPMYLVEEQLFLGREQLPWIESLLTA